MTTPRADKNDPKAPPPKKPAEPTEYEICELQTDGAWRPSTATISTTGGAPTAMRKWAELQGEKFTGGRLRATPTSRITELNVTVETKRQLHLGTP